MAYENFHRLELPEWARQRGKIALIQDIGQQSDLDDIIMHIETNMACKEPLEFLCTYTDNLRCTHLILSVSHRDVFTFGQNSFKSIWGGTIMWLEEFLL